MPGMEAITIRSAAPSDLDALAVLEGACFPPEQAASREALADRLRHYPNHFWLLFLDGRLVAFIDGFVTDRPDLTDDMYARAQDHNEQGAWQMLFGVNTHPDYRGRGYAGLLIRRAIADAKAQNRKGLALTCLSHMRAYYTRFGFRDEGISPASTHGGAVWHQMRLTFPENNAPDPI